jgi:hypothetical protein
LVAGAQALLWQGRMDDGPNWSKANHRSGYWVVTCSMRSSLASAFGIGGLLPGPGPLEGDLLAAQDLPQPFPAHQHGAYRVVGQILGQLADAPVGERAAQLLRAGGGRLDDERLIALIDPAGTASRPPRVQGIKPPLVEGVDHVPHGVLMRGDQPGDRWYRRAAGGGHDDQRAAYPN